MGAGYQAIFTIVVVLAMPACGKLKELDNDAAPGRVVAISSFKCNCEPIVAETVQDTFLDVFFKNTNAKPVKGDRGDIVIVGVLTVDTGDSGHSRASHFGTAHSISGGSRASMASGVYVSGITVQAYKSGELIATHSVGNNLRGGVLVAPVTLATQAAQFMSTRLVRQNEIGRK